MWSLPPWRDSRTVRTRSCAICSGAALHEQRWDQGTHGCPLQPDPFCDSGMVTVPPSVAVPPPRCHQLWATGTTRPPCQPASTRAARQPRGRPLHPQLAAPGHAAIFLSTPPRGAESRPLGLALARSSLIGRFERARRGAIGGARWAAGSNARRPRPRLARR